jgi:hypothetical protein
VWPPCCCCPFGACPAAPAAPAGPACPAHYDRPTRCGVRSLALRRCYSVVTVVIQCSSSGVTVFLHWC